MGKFGMGQPVQRFEDPRLLTGRGRFVSDTALADQVYGYTVRSPYAHAQILSIDVSAAKEAPGVLAVYIHADVEAAGLGRTKPHCPPRSRPDGSSEFFYPSSRFGRRYGTMHRRPGRFCYRCNFEPSKGCS
ncbi:MAG: hypothetical protein QGG84_03440 [Rhodospirillales bacterium]|nr:hypothetical protein [Rhodospirillales bacterium]